MDSQAFSPEELARYSRHILLPEFNISGQAKLKQSKVLVVGAGGLGSPLLLYLAAAGIGTIGIVEFDVVDDSNLQRQVLYTTEDVGKYKVEAAITRLSKLNPHIRFIPHPEPLTTANALEIIAQYDVIADGTDNFATRYLVNDACVLLGKPNVYTSIFRFEGQASVFNLALTDGKRGPNYRDLFPEPPPAGSVPSCSEGGVLGVLPGIMGCVQANEVIKIVAGIGETLSGRLFVFDALRFETRIFNISPDPQNPLTGLNPTQKELIDYDLFCNVDTKPASETYQQLSPEELEKWRKDGVVFQLIDVRDSYEYEIVNLGGELIPLSQIVDNTHRIERKNPVVVMCRSGKRSADAIKRLEKRGVKANFFNLHGGILAYIQSVDPSLPKY